MTITDVLDEPGVDSTGSGTEDLLYTVPTGKQAVVKVRATNRNGAATTVTVIVASGGAATDATMYVAHETPVPAHDNWQRTFAVAADAEIRVASPDTGLTFSINGFLVTL